MRNIKRTVQQSLSCIAGCAGCSCRWARRQPQSRSLSELPTLLLGVLLTLRLLCCRRQPQLPCGGESRLVPQLPLLQSLRTLDIQRSQAIPCRSEPRHLSELPVLPLIHVAGRYRTDTVQIGWVNVSTHRTVLDWIGAGGICPNYELLGSFVRNLLPPHSR